MSRLPGQGSRRLLPVGLAALFLTAVFLPLVAAPAEAARVGTLPTELPAPLLGAATVSAGQHGIFIIGGRNANGYLDQILQYDPETGKISNFGALPQMRIDGNDLPGKRQSLTAVWTGTHIYVFGGATLTRAILPNGQTVDNMPRSVDQIVRIDPATRKVEEVTTARFHEGTPGSGAFGGSALWVPASSRCPSGCAYVFGGYQFAYVSATVIVAKRLDTIYRFTPSTGEGVLLENRLPFPLQDAASVWAPDAAAGYLVGGLGVFPNTCVEGREQTVCASDEILLFDPQQQSVSYTETKLTERAQYAGAAVHDNHVYVFGGRRLNGTSSDAISVFTPGKSATRLPITLPAARYAFSVALHNDGKMYFAGGRDSGRNLDGVTALSEFTPGVTPPTAPRAFRASATPTSVTLTWEAPLYDGGGPLATYQVLREAADGSPTRTFTVPPTNLAYVDRDVSPGRNYTYAVRAMNAAGEGASAVPVTVTTELTVPSAVAQFEVAAGDGEAILRWAPPANDGGTPVTSYQIVRTSKGVAGSTTLTAAGGDVLLIDQGLENDREYGYVIRAVNSKGAGAPSANLSVVPRPVPSAPEGVRADPSPSAPVIEISWKPPTGGADAYRVYRYLAGSDVAEDLKELSADALNPDQDGRFRYLDFNAKPGTAYEYRVSARNDLGEGPKSDAVKAALLTAPAKPRAPIALLRDDHVLVRWEPLTTSEMGGATTVTYAIERREGASGEWERLGSVPGTAHRDSIRENLTIGKTYQYAISAVNARARSDRALTEDLLVTAPKPNVAPKAQLTLLRTLVQVGEEVPFDGSYSADPDGAPTDRLEYFFDFGDGTNSGWTKSASVTHKYLENKSAVNVTLRVRDLRGAESELSKAQLTIGRPPATPDDGNDNTQTVGGNNGNTKSQGGAGFVPVPAWVAVVAVAAAAVALSWRRR